MEALVYTRLSTDTPITSVVSDRIYPVFPTYDTKLPFIVYTRTSTEDNLTLQGDTSPTKYEVTVEYWTINADTNLSLGDKIRTRLNCWKDNDVQGCFLTNQTQEVEEVGYHGTQTYTIFVS